MDSFQALNKLKVLKLNNNLLTSFNSSHLNGLVSLEQLFLNNNFFKQFDDFVFVKFNNSLTYLDVSFNQVENVTRFEFNGLHNLTELIISNNYIGSIEDDSFQSQSSLTKLDLSYNRIKSIASRTFSGLSSADDINLSNNQIGEIDTEALNSLPSLVNLDLSNNPLQGQYLTFDCSSINLELIFFSLNLILIRRIIFTESLEYDETCDLMSTNNKCDRKTHLECSEFNSKCQCMMDSYLHDEKCGNGIIKKFRK